MNKLKELPQDPIPIDSDEVVKISEKRLRYKRTLKALGYVQKYSSYVFTGFVCLHAVDVILLPIISVDVADDFMIGARELYHNPFGESLVFGSGILHVVSGVVSRLLRYLRTKSVRSLSSKTAKTSKHNKDDNSIVNIRTGEKEVKNEDSGLGGWLSVFNVGVIRSKTSRYLGLTPLQFSGYMLVGMLTYHAGSQRILPLLLEGDSSMVGFASVSRGINEKGRWSHIFAFATIVYTSFYHFVNGLLRWNRVNSVKKRNAAFLFVNIVTLASVLSLYNIATTA